MSGNRNNSSLSGLHVTLTNHAHGRWLYSSSHGNHSSQSPSKRKGKKKASSLFLLGLSYQSISNFINSDPSLERVSHGSEEVHYPNDRYLAREVTGIRIQLSVVKVKVYKYTYVAPVRTCILWRRTCIQDTPFAPSPSGDRLGCVEKENNGRNLQVYSLYSERSLAELRIDSTDLQTSLSTDTQRKT